MIGVVEKNGSVEAASAKHGVSAPKHVHAPSVLKHVPAPHHPAHRSQLGKMMPTMNVSPASLSFTLSLAHPQVAPQTLTITNNGSRTLYWQATVMTPQSTVAWVSSYAPVKGEVGTTNSAIQVAFTVKPSTQLKVGTYTAQLVLTGNDQAKTIIVGSPVNLTFSALVDQKNLPAQVVTLKNNSKKTLYWRTSLTALNSGVIGAAPAGGAIAPGKTAQVRVTVNKSKLDIGKYTFIFDLFGLDAKNKAVTGSPLAIKVTVLIRVMHVQPQQK